MSRINVVIPMAGEGTRFQEAGYDMPKPFIDVNGKPMIEVVLDNLDIGEANFFLVARTEHIKNHPDIVKKIKQNHNVTFVPCDNLTEGAACTVLMAEEFIDNDTPLLLANSDQYVDMDMRDFVNDFFARKLDGSIMTFISETLDTKWSFAKTNEDGFVTETREKDPISEHATVGIYLFREGRMFVKSAKKMIQVNDRTNDEFYVCPTYNYLIHGNKQVGVFDIQRSDMHGLGTPEDLEKYLIFCKSDKACAS